MQPERRMLMAALLLALAQQDEQNIQWLGVRPNRAAQIAKDISENATEFCQGETFGIWCDHCNLDTQAWRDMSPATAFDAYKRLMSDDFTGRLTEWPS